MLLQVKTSVCVWFWVWLTDTSSVSEAAVVNVHMYVYMMTMCPTTMDAIIISSVSMSLQQFDSINLGNATTVNVTASTAQGNQTFSFHRDDDEDDDYDYNCSCIYVCAQRCSMFVGMLVIMWSDGGSPQTLGQNTSAILTFHRKPPQTNKVNLPNLVTHLPGFFVLVHKVFGKHTSLLLLGISPLPHLFHLIPF